MADEESFLNDSYADVSGDEVEDDDCISENEDEDNDMSILNKLKKTQNSEIVPINKTYESYYSNKKLSSPFLSKFEKAKILGIRAEMISAGAPALISVPKNITSSYDIAMLEFKQKKIPLMIKRLLPNGSVEYWRLEDLTIL
tara:strand:- start:837 stop:1262 length:426 start_codon:yes stop_codon:yes gene_type:complete